MKTFLLPGDPVDSILDLKGDDFHYLCHVRRHRQGDELRVKTPRGELWKARMLSVQEKTCRLELMEPLDPARVSHRDMELYFCLPKGKKSDLIIRQAVEAEVFRIQPLTSDHSLVRIKDEKESLLKLERWSKIVREALQQSGSPVVTEILPPRALKTLGKMEEKDVFFLHQVARQESELVQKVSQENQRPVAVIIGPEGGFSDSEVERMESLGYLPVYLGETVLRAETAAIFATAVVRTLMGEF